MNKALLDLIAAGIDAPYMRTSQSAVEKALLPAAKLLLKKCDLTAARALAREHRDAVKDVIDKMSEPDLRAVSKVWNPHRLPPASAALGTHLKDDLSALVNHRLEPAEKPQAVPKTKTPRPSKSTAAPGGRKRKT